MSACDRRLLAAAEEPVRRLIIPRVLKGEAKQAERPRQKAKLVAQEAERVNHTAQRVILIYALDRLNMYSKEDAPVSKRNRKKTKKVHSIVYKP